MEWLVPTGLVLCRLGFAYQLWRDWRRHGLTYISWLTLLLLWAGSVAFAGWGLTHRSGVVVVLAVGPGVVDVVIAGLKLRDWLCSRLRIPVGGHHRRGRS